MLDRKYVQSGGEYRFGFNGMERDDDIAGNGNSYTTHFRSYDVRIGRWRSVDPVFQPWQSPYAGFDGNPVYYSDPKGDQAKAAAVKKKDCCGGLLKKIWNAAAPPAAKALVNGVSEYGEQVWNNIQSGKLSLGEALTYVDYGDVGIEMIFGALGDHQLMEPFKEILKESIDLKYSGGGVFEMKVEFSQKSIGDGLMSTLVNVLADLGLKNVKMLPVKAKAAKKEMKKMKKRSVSRPNNRSRLKRAKAAEVQYKKIKETMEVMTPMTDVLNHKSPLVRETAQTIVAAEVTRNVKAPLKAKDSGVVLGEPTKTYLNASSKVYEKDGFVMRGGDYLYLGQDERLYQADRFFERFDRKPTEDDRAVAK